jgi:cobaltochelatase CobT
MAMGRAAVDMQDAPDSDAAVTGVRGASSGVFRSLAGKPGAGNVADPLLSGASWQMLLAEMPSRVQRRGLARWRGRVDAAALRVRFSDPRLHSARQPPAGAAGTLFDLLEQNRVEALGARLYPGARANLAALAHERWVRARPEAVMRGPLSGWVETFGLLCRIPMGAPLPEAARTALAGGWRAWMTQTEAEAVTALRDLISSQEAFAEQSLRIIEALLDAAPPEDGSATGGAGPESDSRWLARSGALASRQAVPGSSDAHAVDANAVAANAVAGNAGDTGAADLGRGDAAVAVARAGGVAAAGAHGARGAMPPAYQIYTRDYDASVDVGELYDAETLARHRRELDRRVGNRLSGISRWAHRLQRALLGLQMRSWQFDREEGELDAGRLSRVATRPLEPLVYRQESAIEFPETVVTLLVDNSGSMRGMPIATAAVCAELLGRVLERCGIKTEILGFTTRSWRGGRAYRDWAAAGRRRNPGRVAELRHVIYKNAEQPWRRAGMRLGAMLSEDLLKENIDGEALLWAHERLLQRGEPRKILLVISDGAPLDDATLEANDEGYLERHLRSVIAAIERRGAVELCAIGIGHDVRAYYRRAVSLASADDLSEAIVTQLIGLFDASRAAGSGAQARRGRR